MARKNTPRLPIFGLVLALVSRSAGAVEFNLPDPPGTVVFEKVPIRAVKVPNERIPEGCDPAYRKGLEERFRAVWEQCRRIGAAEPSRCQRSLFDRCTKLAGDLQKMESGGCTAMLGESEAVSAFRGGARLVDNQKNAQSSTADLNARAYVATQQVIRQLEQSRAALQAHKKTDLGIMNANACANSTSFAEYGAAEKLVGSQMNGATFHLDSVIKARQASAAEFARNSGRSSAHLAAMVSAAPQSTVTSAKSASESTISTATAPRDYMPTQSVTTVVTTTTTTSTPVSVMTITSTGSNAAKPLVFPDYDPPKKKNKWIPILAIGIPAAILAGLAISKMSKMGPQGGVPQGDTSGSDGSSTGSGDDPSPPPSNNPGDGGRNPPPSTMPGGGDLAAWKINVDSSFTDAQRAIIATGFEKIPACHRYKLQGLEIRNARLSKFPNGTCVAGDFFMGGNTVRLSPGCQMGVGITVHELFHVLGNRNGNQLHNAWKPVYNANPSCPVTDYGATNYFEDFAESGRLLKVGDASVGTKKPGACVNAKISGMDKVLEACPAGSQ